jgi:hypothetical protein
MNSHKKVTYTLPKAVINTVEKRSILSESTMSRWLSDCIQNGYEMLTDGYYDNGKQPLVGICGRRNGTIPKTFTVPIKVVETLRWFSKTLNVRTSHLVAVCILNFDYRKFEGKSQRLEDLLRMMDEIY